MRTFRTLLLSLAALAVLAACGQLDVTEAPGAATWSSAPISRAALVEPVIIEGENPGGNRTCEEVGVAFGTTFAFSSDRVNYGDGFESAFPAGLSVSTDGTFVSFESDFPIGAVIVKGSNDANVYYYDPAVLADEALSAPDNPSGGPAGLSNLTFCWNGTPPDDEDEEEDEDEPALDPLVVSKTAYTKHRETWTWTLDKSAEPSQVLLGEAVTYTVTIDVSDTTTSLYDVWGAISVHNPNEVDAVLESVADDLDGASVPVDCGVSFPYTLAGGATLECTYATTWQDGATVVNVATATTSGDVPGGSGQVTVDFAAGAYGTVNYCVEVVDNLGDATLTQQHEYASLGVVCADPKDAQNETGSVPGLERVDGDGTTTFTYPLVPTAPEDVDACEGFEFVNRAKVLMYGLFADDSASVWVTPGTPVDQTDPTDLPVCEPRTDTPA